MSVDIFNPNAGLAPNLTPNPPADVPEAPGAGDAVAALSPFGEAQDIDDIIKQLVLDRPLKLFIPDSIKKKFSAYEFRIINSIPSEIASAQNKGFKQVTDPEAVALFTDLVAGTDKTGSAYRPLLFGRPKAVGEHVRNQQRRQLASLYAGMDPANKDVSGAYTKPVGEKDGTFLNRSGAPWRIRVTGG
jgi:hypothetical protein